MIYVGDIQEVRDELLGIFPDAIRGSVSKSHWGKGIRQLHLSYWIGSDTVGGLIVEPLQGMYALVEWDTNNGREYLFCEKDQEVFIERVKRMFSGEVNSIARCVSL